MDSKLIDTIRKENYPLHIYKAFNNNPDSIKVATQLIPVISNIYRYIEPSHLTGLLVIFKRLSNSELIPRKNSSLIYNMDDLSHINTDTIIIESTDEGTIHLWKTDEYISFLEDENTIFYVYQNLEEYFYANKTRIEIPHNFECASIYALHYPELNRALEQYKTDRISNSSCLLFQECWNDSKRLFFKAAPEAQMQKSLKEFLSSKFRGVEIVREYNLNASKPVDIRIKWTEANKDALIELKWMGKSISSKNNITNHEDSRANGGAIQLKEYLDFKNTDSPNIISKAYLVVIDGRRNNLNKKIQNISISDGLFFENVEIKFDEENKFFERMKNFEIPIRIFAKPIYI